MKHKLLLIISMILFSAAVLNADSSFLIQSDNSILAGNQIFKDFEAYVSSDWFIEHGKRCGTQLPEPAYELKLQAGFNPDCTTVLTNIKPEYYPSGSPLIIPVWFHVIMKADETGNLTDQQIYDQIKVLNEDFRALTSTMGSQGFDTMIQFELKGITRTVNDAWFNDTNEFEYKSALGKEQTRNLNIYSNTASGYLGYSYFPQTHAGTIQDGVVVLWETVGGRNNGYTKYDQGRTVVHEVGHYLGLFHTFHTYGVLCGNSYTTGDLIVQTQSESEAHYTCTQTHTCSTPDPIDNFMNYTPDSCMNKFTSEQGNRMVCSLINYRPSLYKISADNNTYYLPVFKPRPGHWSGLGVKNLNTDESASVFVTIYSQNGEILSTETKVLQPDGQDAFVVGTTLSEPGWIKIVSTQALAGLNFLGQYDGGTSKYYIADVPFTETLSESLLIPHGAQNETWDTTVFAANPKGNPATVTFTYINPSGTATAPYQTTIPANGSIEIPLSTITATANTTIKGGSVSIVSTEELVAFALYNNLKTSNYAFAGINTVIPSQSANTYYMPVFKPAPGHWSGLAVKNISQSSSASVTVTIYNQTGSVQGTQIKTVPANGQEAFLVGTTLTSDGWIKVTSDQNLAGLNFLGEYQSGTTKYFLADVPFTQTLSDDLLIPHVAQNPTWDTTVYIANPGSSTANVALTYTDKNGVSTDQFITTIPGNGSKAISVETVARSNEVKGGSVTVSSTKKLTAFALYHNLKTGNYSFAGINAKDISD